MTRDDVMRLEGRELDAAVADAHRIISQLIAGEEFIASADVQDYLRGRKALRDEGRAWCARYEGRQGDE